MSDCGGTWMPDFDPALLPWGTRLFIFGTGRGARLVHDSLWQRPDVVIEGFIDCTATGQLRQLPIFRPQQVPKRHDRPIIIASTHAPQIATNLRREGFTALWDGRVSIGYRLSTPAGRLLDWHEVPPADQIRQILDRFRPDRGVANAIDPSPSPMPIDGEDPLHRPERVNRIVAVGLWGRSGSYLLSNLLDGHPQTLALPPHSSHWMAHFIALFLVRVEEGEFAEGSLLDPFVTEFCDWFPNLFSDTQEARAADYIRLGPSGEWLAGVPRAKFQERFRHALAGLAERGTLTPRTLFAAIHTAYAAACRMVIEPDPVIVWQAHNVQNYHREFHERLLGPMQVLLTVRDPIRTYDSWLSATLDNQPCPPTTIIAPRLFLEYLRLTGHVSPVIAEGNLCAIRFEDMHNRTEPVMRAVAEWIGIRWDPVLLETTSDRKTVWFKTGARRVTGTRPIPRVQAAPKFCGWLDRLALRLLFADAYAVWYGRKNTLPWPIQCLLVGLLALLTRVGLCLSGGRFQADVVKAVQAEPKFPFSPRRLARGERHSLCRLVWALRSPHRPVPLLPLIDHPEGQVITLD